MTPIPFAAPFARALLRSQSDERLVRLARDGQQGAFDEIVRRYRAPLVAFAAAYAGAEKAEDVVQESLTNAWTSLQASEREIALKPWLYTIVRNRSLNARRDARFHEPLEETIDGVRRPEDIVLERDELSRAVAAVVALPEAQRKALVDSAIEGRTHDQIAAELGTTPGAVRGMIHRGRVAVRGAAGSVVPFPVVAWAAAGAGGVVAGGVAAGSVAGGSMAAKGATVAVIAVLATGSGIVVERSLDDSAEPDRQASAEDASDDRSGSRRDGAEAGEASEGEGPGDSGSRGPGDNSGQGGDDSHRGGGDDGGGDDDSSGPGSGDDDHDSGHGGEDNSGPGSANSGTGSATSGSGSGDDDSSGPGSGSDDDSSGSGSGSDDSSGSGSGGEDDSSGSGSGGDSSGSGSGSDDDSAGSGSGSSGSGSGDDDDE